MEKDNDALASPRSRFWRRGKIALGVLALLTAALAGTAATARAASYDATTTCWVIGLAPIQVGGTVQPEGEVSCYNSRYYVKVVISDQKLITGGWVNDSTYGAHTFGPGWMPATQTTYIAQSAWAPCVGAWHRSVISVYNYYDGSWHHDVSTNNGKVWYAYATYC